jgi:hypothetical protein
MRFDNSISREVSENRARLEKQQITQERFDLIAGSLFRRTPASAGNAQSFRD